MERQAEKMSKKYFLIALIGSFLNRVRGGLFKWLPCNKLFFPVLMPVLSYYLGSHSWKESLCVFVGAFVGQQICGWGKYISALTIGDFNREEIEVYAIDKICDKYFLEKPRLYGFVALAMRGVIWTSGVGLAINSLWFVASGVLMPVAYSIPTLILLKTKHNKDKTSWNIGEWIWGFIFTLLFCLCLQ